MFCKNCGKEIQESWAVCPNCGTELKNLDHKNIGITAENRGDTKKRKHKILSWALGAVIILGGVLLWEGLDINMEQILKSGRPSTSAKDRNKKNIHTIPLDETKNAAETQKTVIDFSNMDYEELTNKAEENLEEFGLEKTGNIYIALNGNVQVACDEGKVSSILIKKDSKPTPAFHTVKIGMEEETAKIKLSDAYPELEDITGNLKFLNFDTGESVECELADSKVAAIRYQVLSELEIARLKEIKEKLNAEYIFPDSDKRYLSEQEIRNKDASQLLRGKNEIFARHGAIFEMREGESLYEGTVVESEFNTDAEFNDFEKANVELIQQIENEMNGVNEVQQNQAFTIQEGTYVNEQILPEFQSLVTVHGVSVDWFEIKILTVPETNTMTLYGGRADDRTIQATEHDTEIPVILCWDSAGEVTLTREGEFTGMDSAIFNELTNAHYTLAPGF